MTTGDFSGIDEDVAEIRRRVDALSLELQGLGLIMSLPDPVEGAQEDAKLHSLGKGHDQSSSIRFGRSPVTTGGIRFLPRLYYAAGQRVA